MAAKRKLGHDEFEAVLAHCRDTTAELNNAAERWDMVRPPAGLEEAAQTLNRLTEATARLERYLLAHIANAGERRRLEAEFRGRAEGGTDAKLNR